MVRADERAMEIKQSAERQEEPFATRAARRCAARARRPKWMCSARPPNRT
jgi:hypothetical protein